MKKVNAVVCLTIILTLFSSLGYSQDSVKDNLIRLSLEDSINYSIENNRDLKIQDIMTIKGELEYQQSISSIDDFDEKLNQIDELPSSLKPAMDLSSHANAQLQKLGVPKKGANLNRNIYSWNKQIKENQIKYDVEKAYFDLLQIEKELEIAKEGLELTKKQYDQSKKMFELGTISKQQLLSVELAVSQAQSGYDAAVMGYELQKMNFCNTLGLSLDMKVILTDKIEYKEYKDIDLGNAIKEALENNIALKSAKEGYEISKLTFKAIQTIYSEISYKYREQEIAVEQSAKNLDMAKNGVEMSVRAAYYSLITAEKQIKTYEKAVENAQKAYELTELSYELGQNTANDVTKARIDLMDAKKNLSKQIHAYNLALLDYKYSIGLGKNTISGGM